MRDRTFKSGLSWMLDEFVVKLKTEGKYRSTYQTNLHCFDNYVYDNFRDSCVLEEDMLQWLEQRETEKASSCKTRTAVVRGFIDYANKMGWFNISTPEIPRCEEAPYIPHFFNLDELDLFFKTCDEVVINSYKNWPTYSNLLNKIQLPIFFRMLYSSGFRPCELLELELRDLDVDAAAVIIRKSKNRNERLVALHDSVIPYLRQYLSALNAVMKDPVYLFPDRKGSIRPPRWQSDNFKKIWSLISEEEARCYDLRHQFITTNISSWPERSYDFDGRLVFLSKYVGHSSIEQTAAYFQFTPMLIHKLNGSYSKRFKDLCPPPPEEPEDDED